MAEKPRRKKILIADDEADVLKVLAYELSKNGYDVVTAVDGEEALTMISQHLPDLILLDNKMPRLDGEEVCKRIKADPRLKFIPVIFITASSHLGTPEVMREIHADDCIVKPYDSKELLSKVKKLLGE